MMGMEKTGIIIICILLLVALNLIIYSKKTNLPKEILASKEPRLIQGMGLEFKVPGDFPEAQWEGSVEEGKVSFNRSVEKTRYLQYFVITWSKKKLDWESLLPESRIGEGGKAEEYLFGKTQEKSLVISGQLTKYRSINLTINRVCGKGEEQYLFVSEFGLPKTNRHFIALVFDEKNKEKEFCNILKSLRID